MVLSGTHGLEGLAGSAAQRALLQNQVNLPDDAAILLIHSVNPYGMAYQSRGNEDNIDLNRNFINHQQASPAFDDAQGQLQDFFAPEHLSFEYLEASPQQAANLMNKLGAATFMNAATAGQYHVPQGINYGGNHQAWSNTVLRRVIKSYTQAAKKVVLLDWHTGLGDFAKPFYLCFNPPETEPFKQGQLWWGKQALAGSTGFESSNTRPNYQGLLVQGLARELPESAQSLQVVIEFGTYNNMEMMQALMIDRWLRFNAPQPLDAAAQKLKTWMIERFYPQDEGWRSAVYQQAVEIQQQCLKGLIEW